MERWTKEKANRWWERQPWAIGCNYVTSNAVNDVEMWMNDTFDLPLIRKELAMARNLGFNSVRVFLSETVWHHEGAVFEKNFDRFLDAASSCGISVMPVLFDDCAFDSGADPVYGRQPEPIPGVHNSRWVPSPGASVQDDPSKAAECRSFVDAVIGNHKDDPRILAWDLFNEPGSGGRFAKSIPLLTSAFEWARAWEPSQPLTAALWAFSEEMAEIHRCCAELSDVISLHAYTDLNGTRERLEFARTFGRPVFVSEWMQRGAGNVYGNHLPLFHEEKIGIWQWGMIVGKTQTNLSWATMNGGTPDGKPPVWQHDLILPDGTPYDPEELKLLKHYASL